MSCVCFKSQLLSGQETLKRLYPMPVWLIYVCYGVLGVPSSVILNRVVLGVPGSVILNRVVLGVSFPVSAVL
jgi:hypothetical protein